MVLENYVLKYEGDISNYLGVNITKKSYGTLKLLQLHLVEKIIDHVRLTVSVGLKEIDMPDRKLLLHKNEYSLGIK